MGAEKGQQASTPEAYITALAEPRREQVQRLHDLIRRNAPDLEPGIRSGMIGYGTYHYRTRSGREGDWFVIRLANNKRYISLYVSAATDTQTVAETYKERLPKADIGWSCVRIKRLDDVDLDVVAELVRAGARVTKETQATA
jgi:hypothetical protein